MNAVRPAEIVRQFERTSAADAELLARFVATNDGGVFEELVRRHGALVLGVCRRVTGHPQDAEDAFQATFLALARRAALVRDGARLWSWLYGTAFHVAWRTRRSASRRRTREVTMARFPDPPAPEPSPAVPELAPILDEELAALPECYREAIVLCNLQGVSRGDAAKVLGIPEGTLSSRLANGRKKLAARLTKRGVSLSVTALPIAMSEAQAATTVPNELVTRTCGLVADWGAGGTVPVPLSRLAEGGFPVRKMLVLGVVLVVGVAGAVFAAQPHEDAPPVDPPKPPVAAVANPETDPQPKEDPKPKDKPAPFSSAPQMQRSFDLPWTRGVPQARWNATGTHLAVGMRELEQPPDTKFSHLLVSVLAVNANATSDHLFCTPADAARLVAVAPDGKGVITDLREYHLISGHHKLTWWGSGKHERKEQLVEVRSVALNPPQTHGYAFAADGKTYRTLAYHYDAGGTQTKLEALEVNATTGKSVKTLLTIDFGLHALSDNGKRLAVLDKAAKRVTVYDLDRGEKLSAAELTEPAGDLFRLEAPVMVFMVFSHDGRRLAVSRGIARMQVINADTGAALPALEGTKHACVRPNVNAFTGDGRLFAALATPYKITTLKGVDGKERTVVSSEPDLLGVWDTQTGQALKTWRNGAYPAFNPVRPLLAILERNGDSTRVGFWDFAAEVENK
jgi:RNA polymerase sigma factor (sigma-70 family)